MVLSEIGSLFLLLREFILRTLVAVSFIFAVVFFGLAIQRSIGGNGPYFIETDKALTSFAPLVEANQIVEIKDKAWRAQMKVYEDSLTRVMDSVANHRRLPELELLNQEANVARHKMIDSTSRWATNALKVAIDSFNVVTTDFSKKQNLGILFGAAGNTVVYGTGTRADKTQELVKYMENMTHEK